MGRLGRLARPEKDSILFCVRVSTLKCSVTYSLCGLGKVTQPPQGISIQSQLRNMASQNRIEESLMKEIFTEGRQG